MEVKGEIQVSREEEEGKEEEEEGKREREKERTKISGRNLMTDRRNGERTKEMKT